MTLDAKGDMMNSILRDMIGCIWWKRRKATIAIDITDQLYYGKKSEHFLSTRPRKSTCVAYRFLICSIVSKYGKFIIYIHIMREKSRMRP